VLLVAAALFLASTAGATPPTRPDRPPSAEKGPCLKPAVIEDHSGAVRRNEADLDSSGLCLTLDNFDEGPLHWQLLVVENQGGPSRVLWVVPHDNEGDAFDTAVYGVRTYGGTVVAVKTGGNRMNGPQDPNRNFDTSAGGRCPRQASRSPIYTRRVLRWWDGTAPILALHSNERGYEGDGRGGRGTISIARRVPGLVPYRSKVPMGASPDDTMAYVASLRPPPEDLPLMDFVAVLNAKGINVVYEIVVPARNDCSLSNYAALLGAPHYVNLEVMETDGETQRRMVDIVLHELGVPGLAP
jgi:hypothetical protein